MQLSLSPSARGIVSLSQLVADWRQRAEALREWGANANAVTLGRAADELEAVIAYRADELLTLEQAAAESGYSVDHLGRRVREGRIPNAGRRGAPLIRRRDLPRKVLTASSQRQDVMAADRRRIARSVLTEELGGQDAA